ncbi:MAG: prephenate dehydrogenase [Clostridia bacterium]|nr:prephenate dehydrogenase [Clostridia bacterium]
MKLNQQTNILIIGLGVIGGSYAAGLTRAGYHVAAITKEQKDLDYALEKGMIARGTTTLDAELIGSAELVIFALYPTVFIEWIEQNQHLLRPHALITDVTGVKSGVVDKVQRCLRDDVEFIAAHPMAGREQSGIEFSNPDVFSGANYIVTPTERNTEEAIAICKQLGEILGFARISELTPREHDGMIAFLSQLTHCIAVCLMNCNETPDLEKFTGDSFRDLTRIAKINDRMWSELFIMNKQALLESIDGFVREIADFREMIASEDRDGMREKMRHSTERRSLFDKPKQ